jgi:hypothetical protein
MRRLSREQWMTVALALVAIVVTGYYVHQQRHIGDQNQAFASLMGANQAYSSLEHDFREYAPLALKSDLFLGTNAVHGYPEFTDHLFKATVAMDAVYELWSLSGREAPLLSEAPDVARAVRTLPQLQSIVAENDNPRITDIDAVKALILEAAREELDAAAKVVPRFRQ